MRCEHCGKEQEGKKVHETIDNRKRESVTTYSCPVCRIVLFYKPDYCGKCGTHLIWPEGINRGLYGGIK